MTQVVNAEGIRRDVIVIGASAGGVEALRTIFADLPMPLRMVICVVMHRSPTFKSQLADILGFDNQHVIREVEHDDTWELGHIYLAPRDHHLTVYDGRFHLSRGPKEHHTRPAIDPLFMSAAERFGERVVGVLLTGGGSDGSRGFNGISEKGGICITQDPSEAAHYAMPLNAIKYDHVDLILPLKAIASHLVRLAAGEPIERPATYHSGPIPPPSGRV